MQPVLDCNQSIRKSNSKTLKKIKLFPLGPKNKTVKTQKFSDCMLEKDRKNKNPPKLILDQQKNYFLLFSSSKTLPRHAVKVTKLYTVSQLN